MCVCVYIYMYAEPLDFKKCCVVVLFSVPIRILCLLTPAAPFITPVQLYACTLSVIECCSLV